MKFTKWDRAEIKGVLFLASYRRAVEAGSYSSVGSTALAAKQAADAAVEARKLPIVLSELEGLLAVKQRYAESHESTAAYMASDVALGAYSRADADELAQRFAALVGPARKLEIKYAKLIAKIREHGLPTD